MVGTAVPLLSALLLAVLVLPALAGAADDWTLEDILGGAMDTPRFLAEHWQTRPLYTNGSRVGGSSHRAKIEQLLSLDQLDVVGNTPELSRIFRQVAENIARPEAATSANWWDLEDAWPVSAYKDGFARQQLQHLTSEIRWPFVNFTYSTVGDAYLDGATLVFAGLERYWQPVGALCAALIKELEWVFTINAYVTPTNSQGFGLHTDNQDVFVLQLSGRKDWRVLHRPIVDPIQGQMLGRPGSLDPTAMMRYEEAGGQPEWEGTLEPGDLLYIPRGFVHEAKTSEVAPSMHLTLTAASEAHSVGTFIRHLLRRLRQLHHERGEEDVVDIAVVDNALLDRLAEIDDGAELRRVLPTGLVRNTHGHSRSVAKAAVLAGLEELVALSTMKVEPKPHGVLTGKQLLDKLIKDVKTPELDNQLFDFVVDNQYGAAVSALLATYEKRWGTEVNSTVNPHPDRQRQGSGTRLREELQNLKMMALYKRAQTEGVDATQLETIMDHDAPKTALVSLLVDLAESKQQDQEEETGASALRAELSKLRARQLHERATQAGVDERALEEAMGQARPKNALIDLIVSTSAPARTSPAVAAATGTTHSLTASATTIRLTTKAKQYAILPGTVHPVQLTDGPKPVSLVVPVPGLLGIEFASADGTGGPPLVVKAIHPEGMAATHDRYSVLKPGLRLLCECTPLSSYLAWSLFHKMTAIDKMTTNCNNKQRQTADLVPTVIRGLACGVVAQRLTEHQSGTGHYFLR